MQEKLRDFKIETKIRNIKISNLKQVRHFLNRTINELRADEISEGKARGLNQLISSLIKIFEIEKLTGSDANSNFLFVPKADCLNKPAYNFDDFIKIPKDDYYKFQNDLRFE